MGLLCAMPMTMANGLSRDLERMKRMRTLLTTTAANLAPIQGEFLGGQVPHLMLIGRRGQPFFWSPFENAAGRSEEHTSELQSLMRIPYAVFCLQKKKQQTLTKNMVLTR